MDGQHHDVKTRFGHCKEVDHQLEYLQSFNGSGILNLNLLENYLPIVHYNFVLILRVLVTHKAVSVCDYELIVRWVLGQSGHQIPVNVL